MYEKSKARWRDISGLCMSISNELSDIVADELLSDDRGFDYDTELDSVMKDVLQSAQSNITNLCNLANISDDVESITTAERKHIFQNYKLTLCVTKSDSTYTAIDVCMMIIRDWFKRRFCGSQPTGFHYNILNLSSWVYAHILAFGYYLESGQLIDYIQICSEWLSQVKSGMNTYPLPKQTMEFVNTTAESAYTLTATVLMDVLADKYLSNLLIKDKYNAYLDRYYIYDMCNEYHQQILDEYVDYKTDMSILTKLHLDSEVNGNV